MVRTIPTRVRPDPIRSFLSPKPRGGWRSFAVLSDRDERTWNSLAERVASILEPRLDPRVAANRTVLARGVRRVEDLGTALLRARAIAPSVGLLLRTDVEDFYPSITPEVLVRTLAELGVPRQDSRLAGQMIDGWSESGYRGLPIGPVGSAVLANALLASVDTAMGSLHFVRWVDDYLFAVPSERAITGILDGLDISLEQLHLRRSVPKTELLDRTGDIPWLRDVPQGLPSPAHGVGLPPKSRCSPQSEGSTAMNSKRFPKGSLA
jgi:hypothetical protein